MGLLFILPATQAETDRLHIKDNSITFKSYGLPLIFWGYFLAINTFLLFMFLAIRAPLFKLIRGEDPINTLLGQSVLLLFIVIPLALLLFLFYEKVVIKERGLLKIIHRFFWIPIFKKTCHLSEQDSFEVSKFLDGANVARLENNPELRAFQNNGYYNLFLKSSNGKNILIDRSSRKADLEKIKNLLLRF